MVVNEVSPSSDIDTTRPSFVDMIGEKLILRLLYLSPTLTVVPLEFKNAFV